MTTRTLRALLASAFRPGCAGCALVFFVLGAVLESPRPARAQLREAGLEPGLYRLEMRQASATKFAVFGKARSASVAVALAELSEAEDGLLQVHRVCDVRFESGMPMVRMLMPEQTVQSLERPTYAVELGRDDEGWSYRADLGVEHVGYTPADDAPLPQRVDDPAVIDSDGDGLPGATIQLDVPVLDPFELHVVQRKHTILEGRVLPGSTVEGGLRLAHFEQRVLAARPYFLKRSPKVSPDDARSHFRLTPVPPESSCASLLEPASAPAVDVANAD